MARPNLLTPTVSASNVSRAITDSLVNPKAQQFVAPSPTMLAPQTPGKKENKKPLKGDPMTCFTFTIRTSMLAKLHDFAAAAQADSGELNLSLYMRGIMKRHIDKLEQASSQNLSSNNN